MLKRILSIFISVVMGLVASAAVLAFARHPAGVAWAAPDSQPLSDVLTVGGACGQTIQECINAAQLGDEVHIPAGLYIESVTVDKSISVTGDLSSTTIMHAVDSQRVMTITGGASVYLADVMLTGGVFTSTGGFDPTLCGGGLRVYAAESAALQDVAIVSNTADCGGGLGIYGSGPVTLDGADIVSNTAGVGGGVLSAYGLLNLVGGSIRDNVGTYVAGGIEQEHGDFTMSGGEVVSNSTPVAAGGVDVFGPDAVFTQTGGIIAGNYAAGAAGGLMDDSATVLLLGGEIRNNRSGLGGGVAVFTDMGGTSDLVLNGGLIASNTATSNGGGVYLGTALSSFALTAGAIEHNSATYLGGGLYQEGGQAWLQGTGQIFSNTAGNFGGGVSLDGTDSMFTQTGGSVSSNMAQIGGGGIDSQGSRAVLLGGQVFSNTAPNGGGIAANGGVIEVGGTSIFRNSGDFGGAIWMEGSHPVLTQTAGSIHDNSGFTCGGGICSHGGSVFLLGGSVTSNTARSGAGMFGLSDAFNGPAELVISGGVVASNTAIYDALGGGVDMEGWNGVPAIFTQTAGSVDHNSATEGGGLRLMNAQAWISGGDIFSNSATNGGGVAVIGPDSMLTQTGGAISGNSASNFGGGIYVLTGTVTLDGGDIGSNSANLGGGVMAIGSSLVMSNGIIEHNSVPIVGGGVLFQDSQMTLAGGIVYSNSADIGGGMALGGPDVVLTQTGGSIEENAAQQSGGGVAMDGALFTMSGGTIVSNTVHEKGGGVASFSGNINLVQLTGQFVLAGGQVAGNSAGREGGGVYLNGPQSYFTQTSGLIEHNSAVFVGGGLYQDGGQTWLEDTGQIFSNSAQIGGGVSLSGTSSIFNQIGGSISDNLAQYGGGLATDGALATLSGGSIRSNNAQYGGGAASFSDFGAGQLVLAGGQIASNTATVEGGGIYLDGSASFVTQTSGSLENNVGQYLGGGIFQQGGQVVLTGGDLIGNHSELGGGVVVWGPDSVFSQTGGQISFNSADSMGAMYIGHTGSVTVSISGGLIYSNSADSTGIGAIGVDIGSFVTITGSRILSNSGGGGGAINQFAFSGPASVTVANTCIAGNGPTISVVNTGGPTINARGNWWGAADGPSGVGPGHGDAVSSGVDYSGFLATPPVDGCPAPTANLTVSQSGTGAGLVTSTPAGIDCGADCSAAFDVDTVVTLTATPAVSSAFAGWTGACNGTGLCAVTLNQSTLVTATFDLKTYSLTVGAAGSGGGNITSTPAGIDCGSACNQAFDYGTVVTLTATPAVSSTFAGWSGACGSVGACIVTMTQTAQVTATFTLRAILLTASQAGNGSGSVRSLPAGIDCGSACNQAFDYGTVVTLTATPAVSSTFTSWSGACGGAGTCVVTMTQSAQVTATFTLRAISLAASLAGNGVGSVTSLPAGVDCGRACSDTFDYGTVVTLTAMPAVSSTFAGWSGACDGQAACVITLSQPALVTATFTLNGYPLTVSRTGNGSGAIASLPAGIDCGITCSAGFSHGTVVSLTVQPAASSIFGGWQGGCAGLGACVVTLTQPTLVTATFALKFISVTVVLSGTGAGRVTSFPAGLDCGPACTASFTYGTALTLTAAPTAGSSFAGWGGACTGNGTCGPVITQAVTVTAAFNAQAPRFKIYLPMVTGGATPVGAPHWQWPGGWRVLDAIVSDWR